MATDSIQRRLTDEQLTQYREEGYLVVPNVLSPEEVDTFKAEARRLALGDFPLANELIVRDVKVAKGVHSPDDPEKGLWKLLNPDRVSDLFVTYPQTPNLADVVEQLLGPDFKSFLLMMIYKPPGIEAEHPFHQDAFYFPFGPHDNVLGSWLALDPVDGDNGTLRVVPRSHKSDLIPHDIPAGEMVNFGVFGAEGYEGGRPEEIVLEMNPGDCAFFHSKTLHRTGSNVSERHRRVITVHFCNSHCAFTGPSLPQFRFREVRGESFEGCV